MGDWDERLRRFDAWLASLEVGSEVFVQVGRFTTRYEFAKVTRVTPTRRLTVKNKGGMWKFNKHGQEVDYGREVGARSIVSLVEPTAEARADYRKQRLVIRLKATGATGIPHDEADIPELEVLVDILEKLRERRDKRSQPSEVPRPA